MEKSKERLTAVAAEREIGAHGPDTAVVIEALTPATTLGLSRAR